MIKPSDLITLSNHTFFDNDEGLITPDGHRVFNSTLVDYIQAIQPATFVVDNNTALAEWVNNTAGNDYTHVLIKPGSFFINKTIDLELTGTKTIVGMAGNKIRVAGETMVGVKGSNILNNDCFIMGLNVEVTEGKGVIAFQSCNHLLKCSGIIRCTSLDKFAAFYQCNYLSHCLAFCTSHGTGAYAYSGCKYLDNCYGYTQTTTGHGSYCFDNCSSLNNCNGEATGVGSIAGFYKCLNLTNCYANATARNNGSGFLNCENLVNCTGISTTTGSAASYCFFHCYRLINCGGRGLNNGDAGGYSFCECRYLFGCYPYGTSKSETYLSCYMSQSGTINPVADTAQGGYNMTLLNKTSDEITETNKPVIKDEQLKENFDDTL